MAIVNRSFSATHPLRKDALTIFEAGYRAVDIETLTRRRVRMRGNVLSVSDVARTYRIDLSGIGRLWVIGFGKGSHAAVSVIAGVAGKKLTGAIALDVRNSSGFLRPSRRVKVFLGTHPRSSSANIRATRYIVRTLETLQESDLVVFVIGGGGSSLLCGSDDERVRCSTVFDVLTRKGASIKELNTVRKHLSAVKGGGLAYITYPARSVSLIVSDVCGNDFSTIASGPTVYDPTSVADAQAVLRRYDIPYRKLRFIETPKNKKYFTRASHFLLACNEDALVAMQAKARSLGYRSSIVSLVWEGDAHRVFGSLVRRIGRGEALLIGGETTVKLSKKSGRGGRNQEAVLAAVAQACEGKLSLSGTLVASVSSDGWDNTPVAGALADSETVKNIIARNIDPRPYLSSNNSFAFFKKAGGHVIVKRRAFNVSDLMLVIKLL